MKNYLFQTILGVAAVAGFLTLGSGRAEASLIVTTPTFVVSAGSSGSFDVVLTNDGGSAVNIGGFSFGISSTNPGISFSSANIFTAATYIFDGDSLFGPGIDTSSGASLTASDNPDVAHFFPVGANTTVGLGHVSYTVSSTASLGPSAITLDPIATSLSDSEAFNIPIDGGLSSGTITVTPSAVPEPATYGLAGIAILLCVARKRAARFSSGA